MDPGITYPESSSINTTDCLLRAVLHILQQLQEKDANDDFNWDPLSFVVTVVIGVVALLFAATTIFQGVLTTSPGRRKCSYEAIGPWSALTRRRWNWSELRRDSIAYTPLITVNMLRNSLSIAQAMGLDEPEPELGHVAKVLRFLRFKHFGSGSHSPCPPEGFRSTWMRLIHPLGLDVVLWQNSAKTKDWAGEHLTAADYLPNEIQAIPAFFDINSIIILAAITGCNKLTMDPDLNYPALTGPWVQIRFRRDPSLGIVGTFETYSFSRSPSVHTWDLSNLKNVVDLYNRLQEGQVGSDGLGAKLETPAEEREGITDTRSRWQWNPFQKPRSGIRRRQKVQKSRFPSKSLAESVAMDWTATDLAEHPEELSAPTHEVPYKDLCDWDGDFRPNDLLDPDLPVEAVPLVFPVKECIAEIMICIEIMAVQTPSWLYRSQELQTFGKDLPFRNSWKSLSILLKVWEDNSSDPLQLTQAIAKLAADTVHQGKGCHCFRCNIKNDLDICRNWWPPKSSCSAEDDLTINPLDDSCLVSTLVELSSLGDILKRHDPCWLDFVPKKTISERLIRTCYRLDRFFNLIRWIPSSENFAELARGRSSGLLEDVRALLSSSSLELPLLKLQRFAKTVIEAAKNGEPPEWNFTDLGGKSIHTLSDLPLAHFLGYQHEPRKHIRIYQAILRATLCFLAMDNTEIRAAGIGNHIVPFL